MNWDDFLSGIRTDLGDTGTTPKYPDALLYSYFRSAIWDVSMYFPRRFDHVTLEVDEADAKKFGLPDDFISEIVVECPEDNLLLPRRDRPGFKRTPSTHPLFYEVSGNNLYLDANPGGATVLLSYYGVHGLPVVTTGDDDAITYTDGAEDPGPFILTVPDRDIELVAIYIKALINQRERTKQSSLDRFKLSTGTRQDNPIAPEVEDYFAEYRSKIGSDPEGRYFSNDPEISMTSGIHDEILTHVQEASKRR